MGKRGGNGVYLKLIKCVHYIIYNMLYCIILITKTKNKNKINKKKTTHGHLYRRILEKQKSLPLMNTHRNVEESKYCLCFKCYFFCAVTIKIVIYRERYFFSSPLQGSPQQIDLHFYFAICFCICFLHDAVMEI